MTDNNKSASRRQPSSGRTSGRASDRASGRASDRASGRTSGRSPQRAPKKAPGKTRTFLPVLIVMAGILFMILAHTYLSILLMAGGSILILLLAWIFARMILNKKSPGISKAGRILSVILVLVLLLGSFAAYRGDLALQRIAGTKNGNYEVSLVVLKDSDCKDAKDVLKSSSNLIAYNETYDQPIAGVTAKEIEKETGMDVSLDPYSRYSYLVQGLEAGSAGAILVNETHRSLIEKVSKNFSKKTKILTTYSIPASKKVSSDAVKDPSRECSVIYVSGIDARKEVTSKSRSDANMLVVINPSTKQILLLGIPRDYFIPFPSTGSSDKLTHSGLYGVGESIGALEDLLGIDINYYARVNFSAAVEMVDAVGGITVDSPVAFTTLDDKYEIKEGKNHLNGDQALYFMRSRKMLKGGDNDRVSNQIRVLKALLKKVVSPLGLLHVNSVMRAAETNIITNMSLSEMRSLVRYQLGHFPSWDIQNYQLAGSDLYTTQAHLTWGTRTYVMQPDADSVAKGKALIEDMLDNKVIKIK
ncbi:MAG: LCP family protein [Lachnospiraceae bacterium]